MDHVPTPIDMFRERFRLSHGFDPWRRILEELSSREVEGPKEGPVEPRSMLMNRILVEWGYLGSGGEREMWLRRVKLLEPIAEREARKLAEVKERYEEQLKFLRRDYEGRISELKARIEDQEHYIRQVEASKLLASREAIRETRGSRRWIVNNVEDDGEGDFRVDLRADVEWVYRNLDRCALPDGTINLRAAVGKAPTAGAVSYLVWAAKNRNEFLQRIVPKVLAPSARSSVKETPRQRLEKEKKKQANKRVLDLLADD